MSWKSGRFLWRSGDSANVCLLSRIPKWPSDLVWNFGSWISTLDDESRDEKGEILLMATRNPAKLTSWGHGSLSHCLQGFSTIPGFCLGFLNHQPYDSWDTNQDSYGETLPVGWPASSRYNASLLTDGRLLICFWGVFQWGDGKPRIFSHMLNFFSFCFLECWLQLPGLFWNLMLNPGNTLEHNCKPRWWFQIFFIFTPIWGRFPIWLWVFLQAPTRNVKLQLNRQRLGEMVSKMIPKSQGPQWQK